MTINRIIVRVILIALTFLLLYSLNAHAEEAVFFEEYSQEIQEEVYEEEPVDWVQTWTEELQPIAQQVWDEYVGNPELLTEESYSILDELVLIQIWIRDNPGSDLLLDEPVIEVYA